MYGQVTLGSVAYVAAALGAGERSVFDVCAEDEMRREGSGAGEGTGAVDCAGELEAGGTGAVGACGV